jgi:hypothetical protein
MFMLQHWQTGANQISYLNFWTGGRGDVGIGVANAQSHLQYTVRSDFEERTRTY